MIRRLLMAALVIAIPAAVAMVSLASKNAGKKDMAAELMRAPAIAESKQNHKLDPETMKILTQPAADWQQKRDEALRIDLPKTAVTDCYMIDEYRTRCFTTEQ
jgi:hypothetical protein